MGHKIILFLLAITIILIPSFTPPADFEYEQIKVILFILLITLTGFVWLIKKNYQIKWNSLKKSGLIFILVLLLTSLLGVDPKISFLGREPYFQGLVMYSYLFLFSLIISFVRLKIDTWAIFLSASSLIVSMVAIEQGINLYLLGREIPTYAGRVISTFGQPNFYSGFILMSLPFTFFLTSKSRYWWIPLSLSIAAILISLSRISVGMMTLLIVLWLMFKLNFKLRLILASLAVVVIISTAIISLDLSTGLIWEEFIHPQNLQWLVDNSPEKRIYLWQVIGNLAIKQPILGYGLENIEPAYLNFFAELDFNSLKNPVAHGLKNLVVDRAHSYPLDLLMFSGIVGLGSWTLLLWQLFKRPQPKMVTTSLLIYVVWSIFQIQSIAHLMFFWLLVGMGTKEDS